MRTSCRVAANRSWPTSVERRSADSTETRPTRARPSARRASDTTIATTPGQTGCTGHRPIRPHGTVGDVGTAPITSPALAATSATPIPVPTHDRTFDDEATRAAPKARTAVATA